MATQATGRRATPATAANTTSRSRGSPRWRETADPLFRGDAAKHNPEDLFLTSVAACHMLFFLSLSAGSGVRVLAYEDSVRGTMRLEPGGGGRFEEVRLNPVVTIADPSQAPLTEALHDEAHRRCFIASSCSVPIRHSPTVRGPDQL